MAVPRYFRRKQVLPTQCGSRFFEVHAHDNYQLISKVLSRPLSLEAYSIAASGSCIEHGPESRMSLTILS